MVEEFKGGETFERIGVELQAYQVTNPWEPSGVTVIVGKNWSAVVLSPLS